MKASIWLHMRMGAEMASSRSNRKGSELETSCRRRTLGPRRLQRCRCRRFPQGHHSPPSHRRLPRRRRHRPHRRHHHRNRRRLSRRQRRLRCRQHRHRWCHHRSRRQARCETPAWSRRRGVVARRGGLAAGMGGVPLPRRVGRGVVRPACRGRAVVDAHRVPPRDPAAQRAEAGGRVASGRGAVTCLSGFPSLSC